MTLSDMSRMDTSLPTLYTYGVEPATGSIAETGKSIRHAASDPLYPLAQVVAAGTAEYVHYYC